MSQRSTSPEIQHDHEASGVTREEAPYRTASVHGPDLQVGDAKSRALSVQTDVTGLGTSEFGQQGHTEFLQLGPAPQYDNASSEPVVPQREQPQTGQEHATHSWSEWSPGSGDRVASQPSSPRGSFERTIIPVGLEVNDSGKPSSHALGLELNVVAGPTDAPASTERHDGLKLSRTSLEGTRQGSDGPWSGPTGLFGPRTPGSTFVGSLQPSSSYLDLWGRSRATPAGSPTPTPEPGRAQLIKGKTVSFLSPVSRSIVPRSGGSASVIRETAQPVRTQSQKPRDEPQINKAAAQAPPQSDIPLPAPGVDIWPLYLEHALVEDKETVQAWNSDLDAILIFAALFSAVLTTLVIESYKNLQPDPQVEMLQAILQQLQRNGNASDNVPSPVSPFKLTGSAIRVNVYWFSSLIISLSTALLAILAKQWVNYLLAGLSPVPSTQGRHRQYRVDGLHKWNLPALLSFLPILLHVALLLFFAGLVDFVWELDGSVAVVSAVLVIATFLVYAATNLLSYIYPECPFKTSMTVFISLAHEAWVILATSIRIKMKQAWAAVVTLACQIVRVFRPPRPFGRNILSVALSDLQQTSSYVESEKPRYSTLRISSLRYQDEQFISQNATLMDTRVLIWLVHNVGRLADPEELGYALVRFPHLVRHRQLLMQEGASAFLERLLQSWFNAPWPELPDSHRRGVTSAVRALGMLVSEVEVDAIEFTEATIPEDTVLDHTPYLSIQRAPQGVPTFLSPESLRVVRQLLANIRGLPLSLAAFTLRLSVPIAQGEQAAFWALIEDFLQRIMDFKHGDTPRSELIPAVNTVIYLSLCDAARPRRVGLSLTAPNDIRYWLTVLLNIMHHAPMGGVVLRQICWGMCALSWALSPQANGATIRPLVPRLQGMYTLSQSMMDMVSCDQDPHVLGTVVVALESMLWNIDPGEWTDHSDLCRALQARYEAFLAEVYRRLMAGELPTSRIACILVSLTRIYVYLTFFDQKGPKGAKVSRTATMLSILKHLITQPPSASAVGRDQGAKLAAAGTIDKVTRWWTYRAACRIVALYLDDPRQEHDFHGLKSADLIYADNSMIAIGSDIINAVSRLAIGLDEPRQSPLHPFSLDSFCSIVKHAFTQGLRQHPDVREDGGWDKEALQMVVEAVKSRNLLMTFLASPHTSVHVDLLVPAVHHIYTSLFAGARPFTFDSTSAQRAVTVISRYDKRHPAHRMAHALRHTYASFLQRLTDGVNAGSHLYPEMYELLAEVVCISGYLAFFEHPNELPQRNTVRHLLSFLTTLCQNKSARVPVEIRRHAWGALGAMAALYLCTPMQLAADDDPVRHFRYDKAKPEEITVGLLRVLYMRQAVLQDESPHAHCSECALAVGGDHEEARAQMVHVVREAFADAALGMMLEIWDGAEWESVEIRKRLMHHDVGGPIRVLGVVEGSTGELAKKLLMKVEMTPANGHALQRRLTL